MVQVQLSPTLSIRIEDEIARLVPEPVGHINYEGVRYNALPLMGTIGEVWLLRADGSFWRADSDWGLELEPLAANLHTMAIVYGMMRYPWLKDALPPRPPDALVCGDCEGTGQVRANLVVYCSVCGALGWVPADRTIR